MSIDRSHQYLLQQHRDWLGEIQPVGLVVAPIALANAGVQLERDRTLEAQATLREIVRQSGLGRGTYKGRTQVPPLLPSGFRRGGTAEPVRVTTEVRVGIAENQTDNSRWANKLPTRVLAWVADFVQFAEQVLGWYESDLLEPGAELRVALPEYGETLEPTHVVMDSLQTERETPLLLVKVEPVGMDLERKSSEEGWSATPQEKFERLLRETGVDIGLLFNGAGLRLVYAPRGETSGYLTFEVAAMTEVAGRSLLGAMLMLLNGESLFIQNPEFAAKRLPKLLVDSRQAQNTVTEQLSEQVLDALWELLRGFQSADADVKGRVLGDLGTTDPQHIYGGLVTALMRLVFLLYAEERSVMPDDDLYQRNYSVVGLYEKLRQDAGNHPDTMDRRYGAWTWLLSLFRLVYDGGGATPEYLPARDGQLFDPDEYPFLEGRYLRWASPTQRERYCKCGEDSKPILNDGGERVPVPVENAPRVPDGTVFRVLDRLLMVNGERLTYRALDVEHIGSVYEGIMGYEVNQATAQAIAVTSKPNGSKVSVPVVVNLEALLAAEPGKRKKLLKDWANCEISTKVNKQLKAAASIDGIVAALGRKVSPKTPNPLPPGALYLQPGEERRRSGSHYTPRALTEPIVATTLRPIWERLGKNPTAEQILELKVCDLAMGSGAFLVEACRQIADRLLESWDKHGCNTDSSRAGNGLHWGELNSPPSPPEFRHRVLLDESGDRVLAARRLVAQRCLYGVDKNPFAVNLAKLSLWLFTLAKERPFTFLDHALKCGDSLVGLTRQEIGSFAPDPMAELPLMALLKEQVERAKLARTEIQAADVATDADDTRKRSQLREAEAEIEEARLLADVQSAAFFEGGTKKTQRNEKRKEFEELVQLQRESGDTSGLEAISKRLRSGNRAVMPFNWEVEFPEVFDRDNPGFDAIVGNPPFAGKNTITAGNAEGYLHYLKESYPESHGNSDLVAYFFRRAFILVRQSGTLGLIATNTIAQGDTRSTGLRYICQHGGTIYNAKTRQKWIGLAAVVVSVLQIIKGEYSGKKTLDDRPV